MKTHFIKNRIVYFVICIFILSSCSKKYLLSESTFTDPRDQYKPLTWYHLNSQNISNEGFIKDLHEIKSAGLGGVLVFDVSMGLPSGKVIFNSEEYQNILINGAKECKKLNLKFGTHNCDGWTSSGGPWVKPENSMKIVVYNQTIVDGGKPQRIVLPHSTYIRENFYKDIAIVAYPTLDYEINDSEVSPIITTSDSKFDLKTINDKLTTAYSTIGKGQWVQYDYQKPFTLRTIKLFANERFADFEILKSDDGKSFTKFFKSGAQRIGKHELYCYDSFSPVTARYFRIVPLQNTRAIEFELSSGQFNNNLLEDISYRKVKKNMHSPEKSMTIDKNRIIVIKEKADSKGELTVDLPNGKWTVMRFGYTSSGETNQPATDAGRGLEIDKFSKKALDLHYENYVGKLVNLSKKKAPNAINLAEIDSYEVGPQNWTDNLDSIFKDKYGYDIIPFLPLYAGKIIDDNETIDNVFWDMKRLVNDLMVNNYFSHFTELCHKDGLVSYAEPYGFVGPFNSLDAGKNIDIPMGEFWAWKVTNHVEAPISTAHIYGKKIISCESFTSTEMNWGVHPAQLKLDGDFEWTQGINEFVFHRFSHQSNTHVRPGMSMYNVGSHIDRTQTWWNNAGKAWFKYLSRGSYMLRQGNPKVDLLCFVGDEATNKVANIKSLKQDIPAVYKFDNVNSDVIINRLDVKNGKLILPDGVTYNALIIPPMDNITIETLRGIWRLTEKGAIVMAKRPKGFGGYIKDPDVINEFDSLVQKIWNSPNCYDYYDVEKIFQINGIQKDLIVKDYPNIKYSHRQNSNEDIYFIYNDNKIDKKIFNCSFNVKDKMPELWNPMNGKITYPAIYDNINGRTSLSIPLEANESVFVVFRKNSVKHNSLNGFSNTTEDFPSLEYKGNEVKMISKSKGTYDAIINGKEYNVNVTDNSTCLHLNKNWSIQFLDKDFYSGKVKTDSLFQWQENKLDSIKYYSGTAVYKTNFNISANQFKEKNMFTLNLGKVFIAAEVILNGKNLGVLWINPFKTDITNAIKEGNNELEVRVTNQWTNRLIGDENLPNQTKYDVRGKREGEYMPEWFINNQPLPNGPRKTWSAYSFQKATDPLQPSGLVGPVTIEITNVYSIK